MNFFKALFGGEEENPEEKKEKEKQRNFDVFKFDGIRAVKSGETDFGIQCLNKALEIKEDAETLSFLATAYLNKHELIKSYDTLERLSKVQTDDAQVFIDMAQVAYLMKNYQTMNDVCQRAFLIDDKNPLTYLLLARANRGQQDDVSAVAMLTKAIMLKDDLYDAYLMRAEVLHDMGQSKEAEEDIDFLLAHIQDQEETLLLKGQLRAEADDLDNARTYYNRAISVNPFCQKAYTGLAEALKAHSLFDEGITLLNTAIEYSPEFAEGYKLRGAMKREKGDEAGAVEDLKKALELEPKEQEGINGSFKSIQEDTEEKYKNINPFGI